MKKLNELGLNVPKFIRKTENEIYMLKIEGDLLSSCNKVVFMDKVARLIYEMHKNEVIHGDLTPMNFIVTETKVYVVDFGLSFISSKVEDKAVDLYVFERALDTKDEKKKFLEQYFLNYEKDNLLSLGKILSNKLDEVRRRGRKNK